MNPCLYVCPLPVAVRSCHPSSGPVAAILKIVTKFFEDQNLQLATILLLNFIWCFCDSLSWRYGQICPQNDKYWPVAAILKTVSMFFKSQNLHISTTLLLNFIWCFCDSLFWRYGQICPQNDKKLPVVAILKTVATFFATKIYSLSICICWTWLGASMSLYSKDMAKYALKRLKMPCGGHFENCCEIFWKPKFAAW